MTRMDYQSDNKLPSAEELNVRIAQRQRVKRAQRRFALHPA